MAEAPPTDTSEAPASDLPTPPSLSLLQIPLPAPHETLVSPLISDDGAVTFNIYAPHAQLVALSGAELLYFSSDGEADAPTPPALTKNSDGIWTLTLRPQPGTYRYVFLVDGVSVVDPRNPLTSNSNAEVSSLLHIAGSCTGEDRLDVPHGALSEIFYPSPQFGQTRRMHVYTPPGYERGHAEYPVLYLLHGNGDSDKSWSTVGRANFILDNLIARGACTPMIVVMPDGHWPDQNAVLDALISTSPGQDPFSRDFTEAIAPYIERVYRVRRDARNRAIAGLSMGGIQALTLALTRPELFSSVGLFSSGFLSDASRLYTAEQLCSASDLELLYFAFGSGDFIAPFTRYTLDLFKYYDVKAVRQETGGGHTWANWRAYLHDFAPRLFQGHPAV